MTSIQVFGAGGEQNRTVSVEIVFALDSSGSMQSNDPSGIRRTASKNFVDRMSKHTDKAAVVSWDDGIDFSTSLTADFDDLKTKINQVDSNGGTNLDVGLQAAINTLSSSTANSTVRAIIFLTDGQGTYTMCSASGSKAKIAADRGIRIYSVGLSTSATVANLQDMASCTGGTYTPAAQASDLSNVFDLIYTEVVESTVPHWINVTEIVNAGYQVNTITISPTPTTVQTLSGGKTKIYWQNIDGGLGFPSGEVNIFSYSFTATSSGDVNDVLSIVEYKSKDSTLSGSVPIPVSYVTVETKANICFMLYQMAGKTFVAIRTMK